MGFNIFYRSYHGDGYVADFDTSKDLTAWNAMVDSMQNQHKTEGNQPYFNAAVRAFFINFNLYNPSLDEWVAVEMLVEFTTLLIYPAWIVSRTLDANLHETSQEKGIRSAEFFRFFLSFYLIAC